MSESESIWSTLTQLEPDLAALEKRVKAVKDDSPKFCANQIWYSEFKPVLVRLVGWNARNPVLRTTEAYDIAYEHLYDLLPNCRTCLCL